MTIRWISGGRLEIEIPYPSFRQSHESDAEVIEMMQEMASTHPDRVIAERLNALGYRRRWGQQQFTPRSVSTLRRYRDIRRCPDLCTSDRSGPRGDGRYN